MSGHYSKAVKQGEPIQVVRWRGSDYELITGTYRGCTSANWQIEIGGVIAAYDRKEWQLCIR